MFEDQMVELLPARTTMSWKKKCKKHGGGGNNTAVAVNVFVNEGTIRESGPGDLVITQTATATAG